MSMRCRAPILKWCWHLGQTLRLASRSAFQMTARQAAHLIHKPSVRTRDSATAAAPLRPGPYSPPSRLNQDIEPLEKQLSAYSHQLAADGAIWLKGELMAVS